MMSVYDPLGMAAPFMLPAKVLTQQLTKENADWVGKISKRDRTNLAKVFCGFAVLERACHAEGLWGG